MWDNCKKSHAQKNSRTRFACIINKAKYARLKSGTHMPPTYLGHSRRHGLGHRYGICEHLSPDHNLSQALTAGLAAKLS